MPSPTARRPTALIAGGGIAGPVLAMFLDRAGFTPPSGLPSRSGPPEPRPPASSF